MRRAVFRAMQTKVEKGQVRSTVLRKLSELKKIISQLNQCREIKARETEEFEGKKNSILKKQIAVIDSGIHHIEEAVAELGRYRDLTTK